MAQSIGLVVAVAENGVIGRNNTLPWRLRSDLRRFKQLTMGHWVLMGRTTYESLPGSLPGRRLIVITRDRSYRVDGKDVFVANSFDEALTLPADGERLMVIGGAQVFEQSIHLADDIYRTRVLAEVEGDTQLPEWDLSNYRLIAREEIPAGEHDQYPTVFEHWVRQA